MIGSHERVPHATGRFILDAIAGRFKEYISATRLRHELGSLRSEEIAHIARDMGIGVQDLVRFVNAGPRAADQLPKLLRALNIDSPVSGDPVMMRNLLRGCIMCAHKTRCDHDLAAGTAARNFRSYCPNAEMLNALVKTN